MTASAVDKKIINIYTIKLLILAIAPIAGNGFMLADPLSAPLEKSSEAAKPNVVFILADDLGVTDVAAFACRFTGKKTNELFHETPNIDKLVSKGITFSQAYANPLCSPTRASIMTGSNAARSGFTTATPPTPTYFSKNSLYQMGIARMMLLIIKTESGISKPG